MWWCADIMALYMSGKNKRSGKQIAGSHTTFIPLAAAIVDTVLKMPYEVKITPGPIVSGKRPLTGKRRVKISLDGYALKVSVRDNISVQRLFLLADKSFFPAIVRLLEEYLEAADVRVEKLNVVYS